MKGFRALEEKGKLAGDSGPSISAYVTILLIACIFLAMAFGGATLVYNGFPDKQFPEFVPWFGVICIVAGIHMVGNLVGGLKENLGKALISAIALSGAGLGIYIAFVAPGFSILQGHAIAAPHFQDCIGQLSDEKAILPWMMSCYFSTMLGNIFAKPGNVKGRFAVAGIFSISLTATALLVAHFILHQDFSSGMDEIGLVAGLIGVAFLIYFFWERLWRASDPTIAIAAMVVPVVMAIRLGAENNTGGWAAVATIAGCGTTYLTLGLRSFAAQLWLGKVSLETSSDTPKRGDAFLVTVNFSTKQNTTLVRIISDLVCTEIAEGNPAADESNTYTEVMRLRLVGAYTKPLEKGKSYSEKLKIVIPQDADPSGSGSLRYEWILHTKIVLDGAPDWDDERAIQVLP